MYKKLTVAEKATDIRTWLISGQSAGTTTELIPHNPSVGQKAQNPMVIGADQKELNQYLEQLRRVKG
jgi:hypothetical protein